MTAPHPPAVRRGPLFIISGPSGSGKSTLVRKLLDAKRWPLRHAVSATTRPPRPGEVAGKDYYFWTHEEFESGLAAGEFLEHAEVHGHYYGTLSREVGPFRAAGFGVILDIDVQGARQVWLRCPDHVSIFVLTTSFSDYGKRLRSRGTEDEATIQRRLRNAQLELSHAVDYPYQVLNDDLDEAFARLCEIVAVSFSGGS